MGSGSLAHPAVAPHCVTYTTISAARPPGFRDNIDVDADVRLKFAIREVISEIELIETQYLYDRNPKTRARICARGVPMWKGRFS